MRGVFLWSSARQVRKTSEGNFGSDRLKHRLIPDCTSAKKERLNFTHVVDEKLECFLKRAWHEVVTVFMYVIDVIEPEFDSRRGAKRSEDFFKARLDGRKFHGLKQRKVEILRET